MNFGTLQLRNSQVTNNQGRVTAQSGAVHGGGIWNVPFIDGQPAQLTLTNSLVKGNTLRGSPGLDVAGGGLFTAVPVTLQNSLIKNNTPDQCYGC